MMERAGETAQTGGGQVAAGGPAGRLLDAAEVERAFGEPLERILDAGSWTADLGLDALYTRLDREIAEAVRLEEAVLPAVRRAVLPRLRDRPGAPPGAGVYRLSLETLERIHRGLLFTGAVEACDGRRQSFDTLPVTVTQLGVNLVSYRGDLGSWTQRLYRRDLRLSADDLAGEALALLEERTRRGGIDGESARDVLSDLGSRGIMAYAERLIMTDCSTALWRMGRGQPAPFELLTGSGSMDFLRASLTLLRRLILERQRFVFVPSAPSERGLLTIGASLHPLEFAIVDSVESAWNRIVESGHHLTGAYRDLAAEFVQDAGPSVLVGVYRASGQAPPQVFYAHADHAAEAAAVALADSTLQEHRGFPLLLDLADRLSAAYFGSDVFNAAVASAYAAAGQPTRYLAGW